MTNEIESTKRLLDHCLGRVIRAGKHRKLTAELVERLEEHLEALRQDGDWMRKQLATIRQTNVDIQERLHAVDGAYFDQAKLVVAQAEEIRQLKAAAQIAGEELQRVQGISRRNLEDCRSAEKCSDDFSEKLSQATTVIGQQEQLIAGQRHAIAELYMQRAKFNSPAQSVIRLGHRCGCAGPEFRFRKVVTISGTFEHCEKCFGYPA